MCGANAFNSGWSQEWGPAISKSGERQEDAELTLAQPTQAEAVGRSCEGCVQGRGRDEPFALLSGASHVTATVRRALQGIKK